MSAGAAAHGGGSGAGDEPSSDAGTPNGGAAHAGEGGAAGSPAISCTEEWQGDVRLERQSDVEALRSVTRIDGDLFVTGDVSDLSPLGCLSEVTGDFQVAEAVKLASLDGLEALKSVGGSLYIGWGCSWDQGDCRGNPLLRSIDALNGLTSAGGVYITANCAESDGSGPCAVNAVLERAVFAELDHATTIWVYGNPALREVGFAALPALAGFNLTGNEKLETATFTSLESVEDFFFLGDNPALPSLTGFSELTSVPAGIDIVHSNVKSLAGLEHVTSTTQIYLYDDPLLADLSSLSNLKALTYLTASGTALVNLHGLEAITAFGTLTLTDNPSLTSLDGLNHVEALNNLELSSLPSLASLAGLEAMTRAGTVTLENNGALTSLHALGALESIADGGLAILYNSKLPTCEAEWLRDHVGVENIAGAPEIAGNDDAGTCSP